MKLRHTDTGKWCFECPGCKCWHAFDSRWKFNGNLESPTFEPSLRNTYPDGTMCHLNLIDGKINFCGDCTHHEMSNQVAEMIEI